MKIKKHDKYDKNYRHKISIMKDTKLHDLVQKDKYEVNSIHTMIAPRENVETYAKISSVSEDGLVESIELEDKKFILGVKWHPELMLNDECVDRIFKEFISKC